MLNKMKKDRKSKMISLLALSLLFVTVLGLGLWGTVSVAVAAPIEPPTTLEETVLPPVQEEDNDKVTYKFPVVNPVEAAEDRRVLFEEMTFVQLLGEGEYAYAQTACAGNGLNNIQPSANGAVILIPNVGDLSVDGSNVSIKLNPDGEITFIPRVQGQMIGIVTSVSDDGVVIKEVPSLTLAEAEQLMAAGRLVWTAKDHGPYGNGHGLPGHIAACDPQYSDEVFDTYQDGIQNNGS